MRDVEQPQNGRKVLQAVCPQFLFLWGGVIFFGPGF
jgi:hypothetical protein